ncbi:alpha-2-macroglobulin-like isoform X2 [Hyperolius riggenbachi]|uniref:alpha-2-macroglobulin-like isoform X2 n=1 Tax=Hyperolius riggenbachi TaxID=752182 RepID=UPI0035A3D4E4
MRLLILGFLSFIAGGFSEPQCSVSILSLLKSGETGTACLMLKHYTEEMNVNVTLEVNGQEHSVILEQFPPGGDLFNCYDFQVPELENPSPVFLLVNVHSGNYSYISRRSVVITPTGKISFIQTDKYLYKKSQTVHIYVMSVDDNLHPVDETFPLIYITDPAGNRLNQWFNVATNGSFGYFTFTMPEDPELGLYQIVVERVGGDPVTKEIKADEYVLPKFKTMLKAPSSVTILDKSITFEMSARYTYDQGVPGKISGRLCRPPSNYYPGNACNRSPDGICVPFTGQTDSEGLYKGEVGLEPFQLDRSGYQMTFTMQVTITEDGTNVQVTDTKAVRITSQLGRVSFSSKAMRLFFKKGLPFYVEGVVENGLGEPQSDQVVELQVSGKTVQNLTSDENGKVKAEIDTAGFTSSDIQLQLIYKKAQQCSDSNWIVPSYSNSHRSIRRFFSRSQSFVQIEGPRQELQCGQTYPLKVRYIFGKDALAEGETTIKFGYMAAARARTVAFGDHTVDVSSSRQGEFNVTYTTSAFDVPTVQLAIFCMLKDEVVADTIEVDLEKCFENQVSANFSEEIGTPGSSIDLNIMATPESMCFTRVFDSSLLLMEQGQPITPALVYNSLQFPSLHGYIQAGYNVAPPNPSCIDTNEQIQYKGFYWQPVAFPQEEDTRKLLRGIGLHLITSTPYEQPQLCSQPLPFLGVDRESLRLGEGAVESLHASASILASGNVAAVKESIRTDFPEMWFIGAAHVEDSGIASVALTVPGTITTWKSDALCLSNQTGLGMTKYPANFTGFQKAFVDLSMADSITRGEVLVLVAAFANYMDKCAKVQIDLAPSNDYTAEAVDQEAVKCVCSHQRVSFSWNIKATSLGVLNVSATGETIHVGESCDGSDEPNATHYKDTIVKTFTVQAEGIHQEATQTDFICSKGVDVSVQVSVDPTVEYVEGSLQAKVQVIGDLLGRALTNPESLIVEPTGCGEQNLATLMPIPRVTDFLNLTGRLTDKMRARAVANMAMGYMRQLRYRSSDGSFSAFGGKSSASSWLTLLSLTAMLSLKPYIPVDENVITQGLIYLGQLQDPTSGRFKATGTLFNSALKGGADGDIAFTCAVVVVLSKTSHIATSSLLRPALAYLDQVSLQDLQLYDRIMLYRAFRAVGNLERAAAILENLNAVAINQDGTTHWERLVTPEKQPPYLFAPRSASAEIEMTSNVLIGMADGLTQSTASAEALSSMAKIATWIIRQQNIHGSFSSTSDTVAALEALCAYGALVFEKNATNTVQLEQEGQVLREFNINEPNRVVLQTQVLHQLPGNYSMTVSGNGCVLVQTGVEFNMATSNNSAFSMQIMTSPGSCVNGVAYSFDFQVNCSYNGIKHKSNMVTIEIPLLSGYSVSYDSLSKLADKYPKAEVKNDRLLVIYLLNMTRGDVTSFSVTAEMGARVENSQPKTVTIYDYYERDENGFGTLNHPCNLRYPAPPLLSTLSANLG